MSDTPAPAYDPDSTPNGLADTVGQDWQPSGVPIAPTPVGETFVDGEGKHRHVPVPVDDRGVATGVPVAVTANHPKPWLDVQGHGAASDEAHRQHEDEEAQ